jgi:hypothetical protein
MNAASVTSPAAEATIATSGSAARAPLVAARRVSPEWVGESNVPSAPTTLAGC